MRSVASACIRATGPRLWLVAPTATKAVSRTPAAAPLVPTSTATRSRAGGIRNRIGAVSWPNTRAIQAPSTSRDAIGLTCDRGWRVSSEGPVSTRKQGVSSSRLRGCARPQVLNVATGSSPMDSFSSTAATVAASTPTPAAMIASPPSAYPPSMRPCAGMNRRMTRAPRLYSMALATAMDKQTAGLLPTDRLITRLPAMAPATSIGHHRRGARISAVSATVFAIQTGASRPSWLINAMESRPLRNTAAARASVATGQLRPGLARPGRTSRAMSLMTRLWSTSAKLSLSLK